MVISDMAISVFGSHSLHLKICVNNMACALGINYKNAELWDLLVVIIRFNRIQVGYWGGVIKWCEQIRISRTYRNVTENVYAIFCFVKG